MFVSPRNSYPDVLTQHGALSGDGVLKELIKAVRVGPDPIGLVPFQEKASESSLSLSLSACTPKRGSVNTQ